jgi:sec-independent protein translocase protein TatB
MFDIAWSELLLIGIVALIVIGPKELPGALRTLGIWMGKVRRMAAEFQGQFQEAMREAEIDQLKKDMDDMAAKAQNYAHFDPMEDVRKDIEKSMGDLPPLDQPATNTDVATAPPAPDTPALSQPPADAAAASPATEAVVSAAPPEPAPEAAIADAKPETGRAPA